MPAVRDLRTLLMLSGFRRLLAVRLLSQFSDGVFQVALATYVVFSPEKQASPAAIASAMAVLLLPYSLVGPFAGVLLDRWSRRQILCYGSLLRAALAATTAALMAAPLAPPLAGSVPDGLFLLSALCVTAVNRFVLAGLSASLPRVVDTEGQLVLGNSLTPTAGTLAATAGAGVGLLAGAVGLAGPRGTSADAATMLAAAFGYVCAGLAALRIAHAALGPDPGPSPPRLLATAAGTVSGLLAGLRHLAARPVAARALASMAALRFCYGALTVMMLMLCRYAWTGSGDDGGALTLLGLAVGISAAGFFTAALITPWAVSRLGRLGWIALCSTAAALLVPLLVLPFRKETVLAAAFLVGLTTQGAKIATDTVVQSAVADDYRGRVFALYDMLFNVAFVTAAAAAALVLPPDGRSTTLALAVTALYALAAAAVFHVKHRAPASRPAPVSRETSS
ncbi:MFS transporter [Streptomyces polyrhachis]|uniref:MFS transporter n=1 Tax=Streptomyces polyrhachis TaxID=1282885 RepID=A0ABW2G8W3_9ACTN